MSDDLLARVEALLAGRRRVVLGITGPPGAGKSTVGGYLVRRLSARGVPAVGVPMDGFHLADAALDALGRRDRKGAIDTFDGHGYLALLRRLRTEPGVTVYAPAFERELEQPIAGSIAVDPDVRLVVTEGNYLLAGEEPWVQVADELDEVWYVDVDEETRLRRLTDRHVVFGKSPQAAAAWVVAVDEPNARLIAATRERADLLVDVGSLGHLPG